MDEHPIQELMSTAMENLKDMIEINTIIGDPVESPDGTIIIPVSKVGFGYAAGGSDFHNNSSSGESHESKLPFGGGSGGGVSVSPRSEEHTSELQSRGQLVCRLLLAKKSRFI